jgi:hypothetical protein
MVASETKTNKKLIAVDVDLPIGLTFALPFSTAHSGQPAARPPLPLPWSHAFQPLLSNRRGKQSVHTVPGASLYQTSRRLRFLDLIPAGLLPSCHDSVDVLVAFPHLTIDVHTCQNAVLLVFLSAYICRLVQSRRITLTFSAADT